MPLSWTLPFAPSGWRALLQLLLASALLLLPAAWNGLPLMYPDTPTYLRGAETGLSAWLGPGRLRPWLQESPQAPPTRAAGLSAPQEGVVLAGRSVYYGALLEAAHLAGSLWWAAAVQALCLAWLLRLLLVETWGLATPAFLASTSLLAVATPAGLFAGFLMPDIFAGIALLATALLLAPGAAQRPGRRTALALLLLFALCAHASHLATVAVLLAGALAWRAGWALRAPTTPSTPGTLSPPRLPRAALPGLPSALGLSLVAACIAGAWLAEAAFAQAVTRAVGAPPLRLPHLTARALDHGPGLAYLRQTCPGLAPAHRWAACDFLDRAPMAWTDFLFEPDPARGVFAPADVATKRRLSQEQTALAWQVLRHDPAGVLGGMAADIARQLVLFHIDIWGLGPRELALYEGRVPPALMAAMQTSRGAREPQWQDRLSAITQTSVGVSLGVLGVLAWWAWRARAKSPSTSQPGTQPGSASASESGLARADDTPPDSHTPALVAWVLAGLLLNAVVCAVAAAPLDRFQARVVWLLPLLALGLALRRTARHPNWDSGPQAGPARAMPSAPTATPWAARTPQPATEGGAP